MKLFGKIKQGFDNGLRNRKIITDKIRILNFATHIFSYNFFNFFALLLISISLLSCLENDLSISTPTINFGTSELMLRQFESNGDFINSPDNPALVEASEVHDNINSYLIIDIRSEDSFASGRITNAVNIQADSLLSFFENISWQSYPKIVIISSTGQHAAFCTSILRLLNYNNVYSMDFGMGMWNTFFADDWMNALDEDVFWFNHATYKKPNQTPLPVLASSNGESIDKTIRERAKDLLSYKFDELCSDNIEKELTISYKTLDLKYYSIIEDARGKLIKDLSDDVAFVCYSNYSLYYINIEGEAQISNAHHSHPRESILYYSTDENESDIESGKYLQTLPSNKKFFVYSYSGQRSAFLTAYLRMLGYQAKSMVFGGCNILYYSMLENDKVKRFAFQPLLINNYEYESGL